MKKLITVSLAALFIVISSVTAVLAVVRGYQSNDQQLSLGMVVELVDDTTTPQIVRRAEQGSQAQIIGVSVQPGSQTLTLGSEQTPVYVQNSGITRVFATDLGQTIRSGDAVVVSPLRGVVQKATGAEKVIVGTATSDFPTDEAQTQTIDNNGQQQTVRVAEIDVNLDNKAGTGQLEQYDDTPLQRLARAVVGKQVSEAQVIIALVIFVVLMITEGSLIYAATTSSIISLGRNPMARKFINREFVRIIMVFVAVLAVGGVAIYAVLWV